MTRWITQFGLIACIASTACASAGRQALWERDKIQSGTGTSSSAIAQLNTEASSAWAKRDDKASLMKAIGAWEGVVAQDARNAEALQSLARAYYFLGDGHMSTDDTVTEEDELAVYQKGVDFGERALAVLEPSFEEKMRSDGEFEDAIKTIGKAGMPAAYWYCVNLGRFALKTGLSARLYYKDKLKSAMERILELDPKFFYGAADRYLGAFYSILPSIAGKDLDKSAKHFAASLENSPEYLSTKVVKAEFLTVELDDREMFESLLNEVLKAPEGDNPDIAPENRAAKRSAEKKLKEVDDLF